MAETTTISGFPVGLRVLVTAGAAGIGREIARVLMGNGARLLVCDVSGEALDTFRKDFPQATAVKADVADPAQIAALFEQVGPALGGLDVLVNNAGIAGPTGGVETLEIADWDRTIAINLNSAFYCTRLAVPLLRQAGDGAIINISSVAGRLGYAYRTPYAATKWALVGYTQSLAKELGPEGIRVNAILPGVVAGPRIEQVIQARAGTLGLAYAEMEQEYLDKVSLRRMVSATDIAHMALFLCSPAGRNVSGQALSVCGNVETL